MLSPQIPTGDSCAPPDWNVAYRSHRWRKMLSRLGESKYNRLRPRYGGWLADSWASLPGVAGSGQEVVCLEMWCIRRPILLDSTPRLSSNVCRKVLLWRCSEQQLKSRGRGANANDTRSLGIKKS